ncbi:MAG: bacteriohemerythrin [Treponema sp.]|jgi:hemerythrin|nr:bacteriohemerythrin [Treponema sp.]
METTTFVVWNDSYSVGIQAIDEQHQKLIEMTNNLYNACLQGEGTSKQYFQAVIREAVDYINFHFTAEEQIMERLRYPDLNKHKEEHKEFVRKVLEEVQLFEEGKYFVANNFVRFLGSWILTHIAVSDKQYSNFIDNLQEQDKIKNRNYKKSDPEEDDGNTAD